MNQKILVIDPDPIQRNILDTELGETGFEVLLAEDGESGLGLYKEHEPMLSIVEVNLPDRHGTSVCTAMKTDPELPGGLVTLVSAGVKDVTSVADATMRYHSDYYMTKPLQVERLVWKANELIRGRVVGRVDEHGKAVDPEPGEQAYTTDPKIPVQTGDLSDVDPATLIFSYTIHRRSGSLVLTSGNNVRQIVFQGGYPIAADSNVHGEEFGSFAVSIGTCEGSDMVRAKGAWQNIDRHLGVVAVSLGMMGARDYFRTMVLHLEQVLMGAMSMHEGQYFLEYGAPPENFDGIGLPALPAEYILRGVRQNYSEEQAMQVLGGADLHMVAAEDSHHILRELDDVANCENLLGRFTRPVTVGELMNDGRIRKGDGQIQTILALRVIGALWVTDRSTVSFVTQTVARDVDLGFSRRSGDASARPTRGTGTPASPPAEKEDRTPIRQGTERGAPAAPSREPAETPTPRATASPAQAPPAAPASDGVSLSKALAFEDTPTPVADPAAAEQPVVTAEAAIARVVPRKKLVSGGKQAVETGSPVVSYADVKQKQPDRARRVEIRRMTRSDLDGRGAGATPSPAEGEAAAQRTGEQHFEAGTEAFGRGDYRAALKELEQAITKQPGRPPYHVLAAQSIMALPDRNERVLAQAVEHLKRAIQLDPRKGDPYYLLGTVLVALGRRQEAQFALRKSLQLSTNHRKEAQRILAEL